jgi:hypothetical protein
VIVDAAGVPLAQATLQNQGKTTPDYIVGLFVISYKVETYRYI